LRPALIFALSAGLVATVATSPAYAFKFHPPHPPARGPTPGDPYEAMNRKNFDQQQKLTESVFRPLVRLYQSATPGIIGKAIHNVLTNISEPAVIANDLLQARMKNALKDTVRLTANTTAGFLGLMDVATPAGLPHRENDFGVTLGRWGVKSGPYLFLPFSGPTTVRDTVGKGIDIALDPLTYMNYSDKLAVAIGTQVVRGLDTLQSSQAELDTLLKDAADPYATLRSVYLQNREALVRGGDATAVLPPIDEDEPAPAPEPQQAAPDQAAPDQAAPSPDAAPQSEPAPQPESQPQAQPPPAPAG
jgi:phospholipid-binding lipoprotein MlaA